MSFANEFKRAVKGIEEEIAYYREFAQLEGMEESIAALEELRDKWKERTIRFAGRGKLPTEPFDWRDDKTTRCELKESMNRIIKAAAAAAEGTPVDRSLEDRPLPDAAVAQTDILPLKPGTDSEP